MHGSQEPRPTADGAPRALDLFETDGSLKGLLRRRAPALLSRHAAALGAFGAWAGGPLDAQAAYSDRIAPPRLETHGRMGERDSRVIHNPAYLACHQEAYRLGAVGCAYGEAAAPHLLSFTFGYLLSQADISVHCPVTMTGAVAFVLAHHAPPALREAYLPRLVDRGGSAATAATWVTERQGGSDVGANRTEARPAGNAWRLYGEKWFASNAGADLALVTARPAGAAAGVRGLGCYLLPTRRDDGGPNGVWVRRLKDKVGTRGLATGEIELDGAEALEVAPPPEGLRTMMAAIGYSRVHNAFAACAVQRRSFLEAIAWAGERQAFGERLRELPLVRDTVLDILAALEASLCLAVEAGLAFDAALADPSRRPWQRLTTALAKYWTAKQGLAAAAEALELVGGNGYTEGWATARFYRDAMVLPVWEGPANIQALEVLRLVAGDPGIETSFATRLAAIAEAAPPPLAPAAETVRAAGEASLALLRLVRRDEAEGARQARRLLDRLAGTLAAALLLEEAAQQAAAGDDRKAVLLARFLASHLEGPRVAPGAPDPAQARFDEIVAAAGA